MTDTLKSMKTGLKYVVITGTKCGTFQTGDRVVKCPNYFNPKQDDIMCRPIDGGGGGWLEEWEWRDMVVCVELDESYYKKKTADIKAELARLEGISR
jgi:hypothetical protein